MLLGAKIIMETAVIAALVTFAARIGRREKCPDFSGWWKSEGWPIFIGVWLMFVAFSAVYFVAALLWKFWTSTN
jgi:hypothetical protein